MKTKYTKKEVMQIIYIIIISVSVLKFVEIAPELFPSHKVDVAKTIMSTIASKTIMSERHLVNKYGAIAGEIENVISDEIPNMKEYGITFAFVNTNESGYTFYLEHEKLGIKTYYSKDDPYLYELKIKHEARERW